jgi:hypothetical protein
MPSHRNTIEVEAFFLLTDLVHIGIRLSSGLLLKSEPCNLDMDNVREELPADPDGEVLAGLIGRGYRLCQRCFPPASPATDPEVAIMDVAES